MSAGCVSDDQETRGVRAKVSSGAPTAVEFRLAFGCSTCEVDHIVRIQLPETGVEAYSAKVYEPLGRGAFVATMRADRTTATEPSLRADEARAFAARYGKLSKELAAVARASKPSSTIRVFIWTKVLLDYPAKELLLTDAAKLKAYESAVDATVRSTTAPVVAWLRARGVKVEDDGSSSPAVVADVSVADLAGLQRLSEVASIDIERGLEPASSAWYQSVRADTAAILSSGSKKVCVREPDRPDNTSQLDVPQTQIYAPTAPAVGTHASQVVGVIRSTLAYKMTTASINYVENFFYTPESQKIRWCHDQGAAVVNVSGTMNGAAPGDLTGGDMRVDYWAKRSPWPLHVWAAGNTNEGPTKDTVGNRGHNYLVVGASDDKGTTSTSDDSSSTFHSWRNPTSVHGDRELPHLAAPGTEVDVVGGTTVSGTSFSTPMVSGSALLIAARDWSTFNGWPEMSRAVLTAASVHPLEGSAFSMLPASTDLRIGGGLLNARLATELADPANFRSPGSAGAANGRYAKTLDFNLDFDSGGNSTLIWNVTANVTGRLRAAIAWDSTATCDASGVSCSNDVLDGDIDLRIHNSAGTVVCNSMTYDSSWEMCEIPVTAGQTFTLRLRKWSQNANTTYLGIAWMNWNPSAV